MTRLYVAGPMRGRPDFNFPAFDAAAVQLRAAGYDVFSPAERDREAHGDGVNASATGDLADFEAKGGSLRDALHADTEFISLHADGIALLDGWEQSKGAQAEVALAIALGLETATVDLWLEDARNEQPGRSLAEELDEFWQPCAHAARVRERSELTGELTGRTHCLFCRTALPDAPTLDERRTRGLRAGRALYEQFPQPFIDGSTYQQNFAVPTWLRGFAEPYLPHECDELPNDGDRLHDAPCHQKRGHGGLHQDRLGHEWPTGRPCSKLAGSERRRQRKAALALEDPYVDGLEAWEQELLASPFRAAWDARALSGEVRVTSETGGQKGQKPARLGSIDPAAIMLVAEVAGFGETKYDRLNYMRGYDWHLSYDALQRHLHTFWTGTDLDDESGLPHLAHAAWHCLALLAFGLHDLGSDTRYRREDGA